jgi:predicted permease
MASIRRFFLRLAACLRSRRADTDLTREIASHLQLLEDQFIAQGLSAEEARYAARRAFGGVEQVKGRQRDTRSFRWMDGASLDLRLAVRMLVKYPGLTLVSGAAMAVAIGIGATVFAFFYASLHPTLPLDEGERIVGLENVDTSWNNQEDRILHDFVEWRRDLTTIQDLAAVQLLVRNLIGQDGQPENVSVAAMTASGFRVARVAPFLGRPLLDADERPGVAPVMVVGFSLWRTKFSSDPQILGRTARLGDGTYTIVGVMPDGFGFPLNNRAWIPLRTAVTDHPRRRGPSLVVFGRLAAGATIDSSRAELEAIGRRHAAAWPETHQRLRPRVVRYTELWFDDEPRSLMHLLQLMVSCLVVGVAVNVAILVYARTATRQAEIVVRSALGASRRRIIGQLFVEALVLSSLSAAAGLLIATVALTRARDAAEIVAARYGGLPFWMRFDLSWGTGLYVVGLAALAAIIAGVVPAIKATGHRLPALRQLGGGSTLKLGGGWTALVVSQVALAVATLPIAVVLTSQWIGLANADPGFKADEFLVARVDMDEETPQAAHANAYWEEFGRRYESSFVELVRRLELEPLVDTVTTMSMEPGAESIRSLELEGLPDSAQRNTRVRHVRVGSDFFETFGVPLLAGRGFVVADQPRADQQKVESHAVVVNRTFAAELLGGESPLGRRVRYPGGDSALVANHWHEIVGVVGDLPANPLSPDGVQPRIYHVVAPGREVWTRLAIRLRGETPEQFAPRLREIAATVDPAIHLARLRPLPEVYHEEQLGLRWGALGLSLVTLSVVILSAAGVYALISVVVSRRSREIGIRVALGADRGHIVRSIFSRVAGQLGIGVMAGLVMAALIAAGIGGDPASWAAALAAVAVSIVLIGLLAALGPARRALGINPTEALRAE